MKSNELAWEQFVDQPIYKVFDFFPAGEPRGDNAAPIGIYHHDFQPDLYG